MRNKSEQGFTYIDVMIAIVILLVGVLALFAAITGAVFQSKGQEEQLQAKQIATSAMEAIMAVKENDSDKTDSVQLGWNSVGNVGKNIVNSQARGIFAVGFQPVKTGAGADKVFGTPDDNGTVVEGFQRQIVITDECDTERPSANCTTPGTYPVKVRSVVVTVTYYVGLVQRQEQMTTLLTDYYVSN